MLCHLAKNLHSRRRQFAEIQRWKHAWAAPIAGMTQTHPCDLGFVNHADFEADVRSCPLPKSVSLILKPPRKDKPSLATWQLPNLAMRISSNHTFMWTWYDIHCSHKKKSFRSKPINYTAIHMDIIYIYTYKSTWIESPLKSVPAECVVCPIYL